MEKEIWKDIKGYEGLYQVSNMGRIKSLWYGKEKILKQTINKYCRVVLSQINKYKTYLVHRLVATAFIPNPNNYPCVNHKNEIKTDNCVENLEWVTQEYNLNYGSHNKRMRKTLSISIFQLSKSGNIILRKWDSAKQVERELNINCSSITACCKGKLKTAGAYRWMYYEEYVNRMNKYFDA